MVLIDAMIISNIANITKNTGQCANERVILAVFISRSLV